MAFAIANSSSGSQYQGSVWSGAVARLKESHRCSDNFSISLWAKFFGIETTSSLLTIRNSPGYFGIGAWSSFQNNVKVELFLSTTLRIRVTIRTSWNGVVSVDFDNVVANDSIWRHVAITFESGISNAVKLYIDGEAQTRTGGTSTITGNTDVANMMILGATQEGVGPGPRGEYAEMALWKGVLSAGELRALSKGVVPTTVRVSSLNCYMPLYNINQSGGYNSAFSYKRQGNLDNAVNVIDQSAYGSSSPSTSHSIPLPSEIGSGKLVTVIYKTGPGVAANVTVTLQSGWATYYTHNASLTAFGLAHISALTNGTEGGSSIEVTLSESAHLAAVVLVHNADGWYRQPAVSNSLTGTFSTWSMPQGIPSDSGCGCAIAVIAGQQSNGVFGDVSGMTKVEARSSPPGGSGSSSDVAVCVYHQAWSNQMFFDRAYSVPTMTNAKDFRFGVRPKVTTGSATDGSAQPHPRLLGHMPSKLFTTSPLLVRPTLKAGEPFQLIGRDF